MKLGISEEELLEETSINRVKAEVHVQKIDKNGERNRRVLM